MYGGESPNDDQENYAHIQQHRLSALFGNVFAQRLLLSLRKVDDPGSREVISTLAFNIAPNDVPGSDDSDLAEGQNGNFEGSGSGEIVEDGEAGAGERKTCKSKV